MNPERDRKIATTGLALLGLGALVYAGGVGAVIGQEADAQNLVHQPAQTVAHEGEWPPTPTEVQGQLVNPQPEGVTLPGSVDKNEEQLLEVVSISGKVYKVQKMDTGQYKIIEPEPQLFDIKFLRPEDVASIKQ